MAKWSTSVFAWETQAKDSCSREDLCPCYMLSAGRAMLQWIWRAKHTWQSHRPAFCFLLRLWRTQSILQSSQTSPVHSVYPGGDSYSVRLLDQETRSAPDPPISFSVFTYRSRKHPEDGVSDMHLGIYCINRLRLTSESELPECRCSSMQDFPQLFPTSALQPLHPWRDLHLYMLNAGCLATTSLLNLQMVCWQYPGGSLSEGRDSLILNTMM